MKECIGKYLLLDGEPLPVVGFQLDWIHQGRSLYEVVRVMDGKVLFLEDHIRRLFLSAKNGGYTLWLDEVEIVSAFHRLIQLNHLQEGTVKMVFNYNSANGKQPRHWLGYQVPHRFPSPAQYRNGVATLSYAAERNQPTLKVIDKTLRQATNNEIESNQIYEVVLVNEKGYVTEGSRTNLFGLAQGALYTPPGAQVLPGITRLRILELAKQLNIVVYEKAFTLEQLKAMEALFLSGTSPKVLPVAQLDGHAFEVNHPVLLQLMEGYDRMICDYFNKINL